MPFDFFSGAEGPMGGHAPVKELLVSLRSEFRRFGAALEEGAWDELDALRLSLGGLSFELQEALRANTSAVVFEQATQQAELAEFSGALQELAQADTDEAQAFRGELAAAAAVQFGESGAEERVQRLLDGTSALAQVRDHYLAACRTSQADVVQYIVAAEGFRARAAYFSALHSARLGAGEGENVSASDVGQLSTIVDETKALGDSGIAGLYGAFVGGVGGLAMEQQMATLREQALVRLRLCGSLQGQVHRLGVPSDLLPTVGPLLVRLAEATARLQVFVAAASEVAARLASLEASEWFDGQRERALTLPLLSAVPTGRETPIAEVGGQPDDELVEVVGVVTDLRIEPDPGPKFSTFVTLRDFAGDGEVRLRAHMFSLESNGLRLGAASTVRGFVRRDAAWLNDDEAGLDIDRVSLTELRTRSWTDDLVYRMRPFATLFFDEMNMFYTPGEIRE